MQNPSQAPGTLSLEGANPHLRSMSSEAIEAADAVTNSMFGASGSPTASERQHNWLEEPDVVESLVRGQVTLFREVPWEVFARLRPLLETVGKSLMVLMRKNSEYSGSATKVQQDGRMIPAGVSEGKMPEDLFIPGGKHETVNLSIPLEVLQYRDKTKAQALEHIFGMLDNPTMNGPFLEVVALSIVPSPGQDAYTPAHLSKVGISTMKDLVVGTLKAHERLFGPLGPKIREMLQTQIENGMETMKDPITTTPSQPSQTPLDFSPEEGMSEPLSTA